MTRILWRVAAFLALGAVTLHAQPHPCDVVYAASYQEPAAQLPALKLGWCFVPADTDGHALVGPVGFRLQVDGGAAIDLGVVAPVGPGANAGGAWYYEVRSAKLAAGTLTLTAYTTALGASATSVPITLALTGIAPPTPSPDGTRVPTDAAAIIDAQLAVWTFGTNGAVLRNGVQAAGGYGGVLLAWHGQVYVYGNYVWWGWTGAGWAYVGAAPNAPAPRGPEDATIVQ